MFEKIENLKNDLQMQKLEVERYRNMASQIDQGIAAMEQTLVTTNISEHSNLNQLKEVLSQTHLKQMKTYITSLSRLEQKVSTTDLE